MCILSWRTWCVLGLAAVCMGLAGCPSQSGTKIGDKATKRLMFVTNGDDPFWDALLSGLNEGAKQHKLAEAGMSVHRDVNDGTAEGQIEKLRQYATQDDIAGVAVSVIQADKLAIIEEMRQLQKKGVKVITVDGDVTAMTFATPAAFTSARTTSSAGAHSARLPKRCWRRRASRKEGTCNMRASPTT